jgi:hypothetical protein
VSQHRRAKIPFGFKGRVDALTPHRDLVKRGIESLCARDPELPAADSPDWFGWELPEQPHRYAAVGFGTRGFVVDGVSGHVMWAGEITGQKDLPHTLAEMGR